MVPAMRLVFAAACVAAAAALEVADMKNRPVTKVINVLKDMTSQLEKEGEEDEEIYEQMQCWCETNDKEKTKSISDAESRIKTLTSSIEELTATSSRLTNEIKKLNKEVAKSDETLDAAKALRTKQLAEFNQEEKDALASIGSLKGAVVALSKHNAGASLLQTEGAHASPAATMRAVQTVQHILRKHKAMFAEVISPEQRRYVQRLTVESFLQAPKGYSILQVSGAQAPSGEIFGILSSMKESFETNLANSQQEESTNSKAYEDLKAAKEGELAAGKTQIETKTQELAAADEKNAQDKEDKEDTEASLEADTKFLADVKAKCAGMDAQFAERTKTRQLEIQAVGKALEFLTSDEAHELFSRTLGASAFLQRAKTSVRRHRVAEALTKAARRSRDPRLSAIATAVREDKFAEVKVKLQDMIEKLTAEKGEEIKHKDACIDNFNKNAAETEKQTRHKDALTAKIGDFSNTVSNLKTNIETLKKEVADLKENMKRAGEDREIANKEFQEVVADQRATEKLLTAALNILKGFYEKAALIQVRQPSFKSYEKNEQSGGVMGMMQSIINDAKGLQAEAMLAEDDAQTSYESFVKNTNDSVDEKTKDMINKGEMMAKAQADLTEHQVQLDSTEKTIDELGKENHDLHIDCDYLMKNFDLRTEARDEEIDALKQGLGFFGGAAFSAFLQSW